MNKMDPEQLALGGVFTMMGLGTMLFPAQIMPLSFSSQALGAPGANSPVLNLTFRCFGAQATLCGIMLLSLRPTKKFYRNFGLAILPFFVFDFMAWEQGFLTPFGAIGDAMGNVVFTVCSYYGYKRTEARGDDE